MPISNPDVLESNIHAALQQLARSEKGRNTIAALLAWLDADGVSLDAANQDAVITLLEAAWGQFPGTTRDAMRASLQPSPMI